MSSKQYDEALPHCNRALELDRTNWRIYNNRAAVFVGLKQFDSAMTDVNAGLALAPASPTLIKSREVVRNTQHPVREHRRRPKKSGCRCPNRCPARKVAVRAAQDPPFPALLPSRSSSARSTTICFCNALVVSITFGTTVAAGNSRILANVAPLFILPFFLFSAIAGQLADKYERAG